MIALPLEWRAAPLQGLLKGRPLLRPEHVLLNAPVINLRQAFDAIGQAVQDSRGPSASEASDRLLRRETHRSTLIGQDIALPHAQVFGLRAPIVAYLRPAQPIAMAADEAPAVRHIVALLVPKPAAVPHFELLTRLTQLLRDPALRVALARCRTAADVCELFELHGGYGESARRDLGYIGHRAPASRRSPRPLRERS